MYQRTGVKRLRFNFATKVKSSKGSQLNTSKNEVTNNSGDDSKDLKEELVSTPVQSAVKRSSRIKIPDPLQIELQSSPSQSYGSTSWSYLLNTFVPPKVLLVDDTDTDSEVTFTKSLVDDNNDTLSYSPKLDKDQNMNLVALAAYTAGIDMNVIPESTDHEQQNDSNTGIDMNVIPESTDHEQQNDSNTNPVLTPPRSPTPPPLVGNETASRSLKIRRIMIETEMIALFVDPELMEDNLTFTLIDEKGVDMQGVSREVYTTFWVEFLNNSAVGEAERVPMVKPSMQRPEWEAVGRILAKGFKDHGVFPLQLCKAFAIAVIHGEEKVSKSHMMESFLNYIAVMEKDVVTKAIAGTLEEEDDKDEFIELLDRMGCKSIPKDDEVKPALLNVAYKELIHIPKYSLDAISSAARPTLARELPNVNSVIVLYEEKKPTNKKVIRLFQPQENGREEERSMGFLKQYVKGLDAETLKRFLRHVTGSDMLCVNKIEVHFNNRRGLSRCPVVRTCTPMIELSTTYPTHTELRADFTGLLTVHHPLDID